jgi:dolichyl-diphosphooligosaccharide--protein glycosyltransferase
MLLVAAVGVRALPWREVLEPGRVVFFGNDAWYHARRIAYGVANFPERLSFDAYLAFPHGAKPIWSPGFDWTLAALARGFVGDPRVEGLLTLERILVWVPPLLGAAAIAAAMGLARRLFGRAEAWCAGALLCVLPAHFWYSRIGFLDHHAAVAWLSTLLVVLCAALQRADLDVPWRVAGWAAACGACIALLLWVWPGALLHVGCVELGLGVATLAAGPRSEARRRASAFAGMHAVAALALTPAAWGESWPQWSPWSPLVLSRFQPLWLGGLAFVAASCALSWRLEALGGSRARRSAGLVGFATLLAALAALALPALVDGAGDALRWLGREEPFQRFVGESAPLFEQGGAFSTAVAWRRFGPFVFVYPLALVALALSARWYPERWILFAWCAGLFVATLLQRRFFATASIGYAIVLAATGCHAWRLAARHPKRGLLRAGVSVVATLVTLPLLAPYAGFVGNEWRAWRGEALRAGPAFGAARVAVELADWLRVNTPETQGWLSRDPRPEYGVLAPWHLGHVIGYRARRPTVVDNFGDDHGGESFAWAQRVLGSREAEAVAELRQRRVRYVVAEGDARWLSATAGPESLHRQLFRRDGSRREAALPALVHHRLVYETRGIDFADPAAPALYKVFELVAGAQVSGWAEPGRRVEVALALRTSRGRSLSYSARAVAGPDGTYRLRLPYATQGAPPGVSVASRYRLRCGPTAAELEIDERAVREGLEVDGPTMCTGDLTSAGATADEVH